VKNYMGLVTSEQGTNAHAGVGYGLLGAVIAEVQPADLNILDCTWINANPTDGPWTAYDDATRADQIVASRDPVAADIWGVKNILIPGFVANGYSRRGPPQRQPRQSRERVPPIPGPLHELHPAGGIRRHERSCEHRRDAPATPGEVSDPRGTGAPFTIAKAAGGRYRLHWSAPTRGGAVETYQLYRVGLAGTGLPACEAPLGVETTALLDRLPENSGFLVVARNATGGGSIGRSSAGSERPSPPSGTPVPRIATGTSMTNTSDGTVPNPGQGFWYVGRERVPCGVGSYRFDTGGAERITTTCP